MNRGDRQAKTLFKYLVIFLLIICLSQTGLFAQLNDNYENKHVQVLLKNGRSLDGKVINQTEEKITLEIYGGNISFYKKDIEQINIKEEDKTNTIPSETINLEAYPEIPSGYGKVEFGMLKEQVKQILNDERTVITNETNTTIETTGELFGEKVSIGYKFTPITQKCLSITIFFYPVDIGALRERVRGALSEKYGKPQGEYVDKWLWGNIGIVLLQEGNNLVLGYVDSNLVVICDEEQKHIDEVIYMESKDKL